MSNTKTIAKNTLFLYIRMFLIMGITLYTSRIVLKELGVSDFGIYSIVGGIVAMLGVLNSAMANATQRYLSFDIGKGEILNLKKTFSATLSIHIGIALFVFILTETIGLWYINNIMIFPPEKLMAVNIVYQFSIFTLITSIIQVPYNALILAHEKMQIYAYVSILEVILKLIIVFLLGVFEFDKLIVYSILTFGVALIIRLIYQVYCRRKFIESKYEFNWDPSFFKEVLSYSGWNLFGNIAVVSRNQGGNMLLNLFFGTVINAAYGITNQVQAAVSLFVSNFQTALNPQIIKSYAVKDYEKMYALICKGSKLSFFLVIILFFPLYYNIDIILNFWLDTPPQKANIFIKLSLIVVLIDCLSGPLMVSAQATGKIKNYQIVVGTIVFLNLPLSYLGLKYFSMPEIVFYISISLSIIAFIFRLLFLQKMILFPLKKYFNTVILRVFFVLISCILVFSITYPFLSTLNALNKLFVSSIMFSLISFLVIIMIGLDNSEKTFLQNLIKSKIKKY